VCGEKDTTWKPKINTSKYVMEGMLYHISRLRWAGHLTRVRILEMRVESYQEKSIRYMTDTCHCQLVLSFYLSGCLLYWLKCRDLMYIIPVMVIVIFLHLSLSVMHLMLSGSEFPVKCFTWLGDCPVGLVLSISPKFFQIVILFPADTSKKLDNSLSYDG